MSVMMPVKFNRRPIAVAMSITQTMNLATVRFNDSQPRSAFSASDPLRLHGAQAASLK
jgi:hypothetical protein